MRFFFIRHGETNWNKEKRLQGKSDIPLNDTGRAQAKAAANDFSQQNIDYIISSPLLRAKETAQILNQHLSATIVYDDRLIERDHGIIEGMSEEDIKTRNPADLFDLRIPIDWNGWKFPHRAETISALTERAYSSIHDYTSKYRDKNILFCAHGAWFRCFIYMKIGQIFHPNNADPYLCDLTIPKIMRLAELPRL